MGKIQPPIHAITEYADAKGLFTHTLVETRSMESRPDHLTFEGTFSIEKTRQAATVVSYVQQFLHNASLAATDHG